MTYSDDPIVNEEVVRLVCCLSRDPYNPQRIEEGTGTIEGIIAEVRRRLGRRAAESIRFLVH